jgi:hypothetical protein
MIVYSIALVYDDGAEEASMPGHGRGLMWLVGMDGNQSELDPREAAIQGRMLSRRHNAVTVPSADRMPPDVLEPFGHGNESV